MTSTPSLMNDNVDISCLQNDDKRVECVDALNAHVPDVTEDSLYKPATALHEETTNRTTSGDWLTEYCNHFLDTNVADTFDDNTTSRQEQDAYDAVYQSILKDQQETRVNTLTRFTSSDSCLQGSHAASLAQALPAQNNNGAKCHRKKRRKAVPDEITYVEKRPSDVLFGRGGESNHHVGNIAYRAIVEEYRPAYKALTIKEDKTEMTWEVVRLIQSKGRFLEWDSLVNKWYVVHDREARRKVGQALRDKKKAQPDDQ